MRVRVTEYNAAELVVVVVVVVGRRRPMDTVLRPSDALRCVTTDNIIRDKRDTHTPGGV